MRFLCTSKSRSSFLKIRNTHTNTLKRICTVGISTVDYAFINLSFLLPELKVFFYMKFMFDSVQVKVNTSDNKKRQDLIMDIKSISFAYM